MAKQVIIDLVKYLKISYFDSANFVVEQKNKFNESCCSINFLALECRCCATSSFQKKNNQLFPLDYHNFFQFNGAF